MLSCGISCLLLGQHSAPYTIAGTLSKRIPDAWCHFIHPLGFCGYIFIDIPSFCSIDPKYQKVTLLRHYLPFQPNLSIMSSAKLTLLLPQLAFLFTPTLSEKGIHQGLSPWYVPCDIIHHSGK